MIELQLLGLHALRGSDGRDIASLPAQPKRFALLAYLALAGSPGYHRRDTLAAIFWPEFDQFAARRALRNTLYHLREALGDDVIITRGDDALAIDPTKLCSDAGQLADAVAAGRYEEAIDLYRGELLDGIHFVNAGEAFEEWLSRERARMADQVNRAFRALVDREEHAGNLSAAAYWAQRACAFAPSDELWRRRAMMLFDRAGDTIPNAPAPNAARAPLQVPPVPGPLPSPIPAPAPPPGSQAPRAARWRRALFPATLVGVAALALLVVWGRGIAHSHAPVQRKRVLVTVFANRTGDSTLQSLGRMTQDWLAQGIVHTKLVDVVDPQAVFVQSRAPAGATIDPMTLARRTGAALVVSGSYYRTGDTLLFQAAVANVGTGEIVRAVGPVLSRTNTPVAGLDELGSRVMSALASVVDAHGTQDLGGGSELPPFDAYQDYVQGWDAFWNGDGRRAEALFLQAGHRDSAFANAGLAAAVAASNTNDCPTVDSLARAFDFRLTALDRAARLSLQIAEARCRGRNDEMLRLALERADLDPRSSTYQMSAAAAALWANRPSRALELLGRVDPSVDLAWSSDTTHFNYWAAIAEAYHMLGRYQEELAAAVRILPGAPLGSIWARGSALAALSRPTAALALLDSALSLPVETVSDIGLAPFTDGRPDYTMTPAWVANWVSRELAVHGDTVAARQAAMRALAWYRSRPADERSTVEERLVAAWSTEMLGQYADAETIARRLVADDSTNVDFRGELAGLAAERGDTALADSLDRWLAAQPVARVSWSASVYRARVAALLGRSDAAMARLRDAFDEGVWPRWLHQEPALDKLRGRADFVALTAPRN